MWPMSDYEIDTVIAPGARRLSAALAGLFPQSHQRQADELDRDEEDGAELLEAWDRRGAAFEDVEL